MNDEWINRNEPRAIVGKEPKGGTPVHGAARRLHQVALQAAGAPGRQALPLCRGRRRRRGTSVGGRATRGDPLGFLAPAAVARLCPPVSRRGPEEPLGGPGRGPGSCGGRRRLRRCPLARPSVRPPPGRHHAGAHLPPAGLVPLALLEGGDGADARGAAVLGQDHLRQCHRGECLPITLPGRRSLRVRPACSKARLVVAGLGGVPRRGGALGSVRVEGRGSRALRLPGRQDLEFPSCWWLVYRRGR